MEIKKLVEALGAAIGVGCGTSCENCEEKFDCATHNALLGVEAFVDLAEQELEEKKKLDHKQAIIELHFLLADVNRMEHTTERVKEAYRDAIKKAIYALEAQIWTGEK